MLNATIDGSLASSPMILSAGGHDEQPCDVKSSTTARGSGRAGRTTATIAQTPSGPDHREMQLRAIIAVILGTGKLPRAATSASRRLIAPTFERKKATFHRPPPVNSPLTSQ